MSNVDVKTLAPAKVAELAVTYASLVLLDDDLDITEDKVNAILKAANQKVDATLVSVYTRALKGKNFGKKLTAGGGAPAPATAAAPAKEAAKSTSITNDLSCVS